jgi:hypothetical protein
MGACLVLNVLLGEILLIKLLLPVATKKGFLLSDRSNYCELHTVGLEANYLIDGYSVVESLKFVLADVPALRKLKDFLLKQRTLKCFLEEL